MIDGMNWGLTNNFFRTKYRFANGYGASVIWNPGSYGYDQKLFELAVLDANDDICYDTPITNDVMGNLDFYDVVYTLDRIRALPPRSSVRKEEPKTLTFIDKLRAAFKDGKHDGATQQACLKMLDRLEEAYNYDKEREYDMSEIGNLILKNATKMLLCADEESAKALEESFSADLDGDFASVSRDGSILYVTPKTGVNVEFYLESDGDSFRWNYREV